MATIKTLYPNSLITGFKSLEDGTYKVYFLVSVENAGSVGLKRLNAICKHEIFFGNLISSNGNVNPVDIVVKELKSGWIIEDIVRNGASVIHKDDWATDFFKSLNAKGGAQ
jgi:hypothetical protein